MRYITYEIINTCMYKVRITPGRAIGFGSSYRDAVKNALTFEIKNLFAIDENPKKVLTGVLRMR